VSGKGLQEVPNQHVLFGVLISGRVRLTEVGDGGECGAWLCSDVVLLLPRVPKMSQCRWAVEEAAGLTLGT